MASLILATAGYDHTIRFWDARSGTCDRKLQYKESQVNRLKITPNKQYLAAAGNPDVRLFDIPSEATNAAMSFDGHTSNVTAVGFHKDNKWMYTGSEDGTIKVWDLRAPGKQRQHDFGKVLVNTVSLHPNQGELLAGLQDGRMCIWDLTADKVSCELRPDGMSPIRSVAMMKDASRVAVATNSGRVAVYAMEKDKPVGAPHVMEAHDKYVLRSRFSPDDRLLATCSADHTVKIWAVGKKFYDLKHTVTLTGHSRWVWDCVYSADSAYLVTASSDHVARLWDVTSGQTVRRFEGHTKALVCVALHDNPDE